MVPPAAASSNVVPAAANSWSARTSTPTAALGRYVTPLRSRTIPIEYIWLCFSMPSRSAAALCSSTSPATVNAPEAASKAKVKGTSVTVRRYRSSRHRQHEHDDVEEVT